MRAKLVARGMPARGIDISLGLYMGSRMREFAPANPTLERLLGRLPIRMRDWMAEKINQLQDGGERG